eukprot:366488-Chlamydomonas_euryale.AAC.15
MQGAATVRTTLQCAPPEDATVRMTLQGALPGGCHCQNDPPGRTALKMPQAMHRIGPSPACEHDAHQPTRNCRAELVQGATGTGWEAGGGGRGGAGFGEEGRRGNTA